MANEPLLVRVRRHGWHFWVLSAFLLLNLLIGGSSRPDVMSLILLRPISVAVLVYGLWHLKREQVGEHRFLFGFAAAVVGVAILHVIPLPPFLWSALPGRELIVEIGNMSGTSDAWRPIAMSPHYAWNALFALSVPVAVLVLAVQLEGRALRDLVFVFLLGGLLSALLASMQLVSDPSGPLYFYRVTHNGLAVGLLANRNHQALFLCVVLAMLPVVAADFRRRARDRRAAMAAALPLGALGLYLVPLILITGSRTGSLLALIVLLACPFLYRVGIDKSRSAGRLPRAVIAGIAVCAVVIAGLIAWVIASGRAVAIQRLTATSLESENRDEIWSAVWSHLTHYLPFGAGAGSYEKVYQTFEAADSLTASYSNHAHNDWLEVMLTYGLPGIIMLLIAVCAWGVAAWWTARNAARGAAAWNWLGLIIILVTAVASVTDYPARVPSIAALFVVACLWAGYGSRPASTAAGRHALGSDDTKSERSQKSFL